MEENSNIVSENIYFSNKQIDLFSSIDLPHKLCLKKLKGQLKI